MSAALGVSDGLILAAVERAVLHLDHEESVASVGAVMLHLGLPRRSMGARCAKASMSGLAEAGMLECSRCRGVEVWALTATGRRRLAQARAAGQVGALAESPQHREWREAKTLAATEIERFHAQARERINEAMVLLDTEAASDAWFEAAEALQRAFRLMGSATYCLREWTEPDDAHADHDNGTNPGEGTLSGDERARLRALRRGRRQVLLWAAEGGQGTAR